MIPYESWAPPRTAPITPADKAVGRIAWGVIALVLLLIAFATASCSRNVGQPDARPNASLVSHPVGVDSATMLVQPPRTLVQKLTGQPAAPAYRLPTSTPVRIGKKSQVTIQYGTGNTSTQSSTAKKGQSATGDAAKVAVAGKNSTQATDSAVAVASEGGAVAAGAGAHAEAGATVTKPGFWAVMGAAALRLWWLWLLIAAFLFRKRLPVVGPFFS